MQEDQYNIGDVCKKIQAMIEVERDVAHNEGYYTGRNEGHDEGHEEGKRAGYDEGYSAGLSDACERVSSVSSIDRIVRNRIIRRIRG